MLRILAGVAGKQPRQVAPHHHAAQVPLAPERPGIAHQDLDHRAAIPDAKRLPERGRQGGREVELRGRRRRQGDQHLTRFDRAIPRNDTNALRPTLDARDRFAKPQPAAEIAGQVFGQRLHGLAQEILQLRHFIGDAAVIVDQVPERHLVHRQAPQAFDHRTEGRLGIDGILLLFQPGRDGHAFYRGVVRLDAVHPLADRHGAVIGPLGVLGRH